MKRVDSTKHVQKTQLSGRDTVMLSSTVKLVALKHEESEDSTLIHNPRDEANERLKTKVLQNIVRKFDVSLLRMVHSQPGSLGNIHDFVHVGDSAPQQRRRRLQTHHPENGSAEDADDLRNGASTRQQPQCP